MRLLVLVLLCIVSFGACATYDVHVRRVNHVRPCISSRNKQFGASIYTYNYNCAFLPIAHQNGALLVRSQNNTDPHDIYAVGPSVITYVNLKSSLKDLDFVDFEDISYTNVVIEPNGPLTAYGTEDPRAVFNPTNGLYYILYSAVENTTNGIPISRLALGEFQLPKFADKVTATTPTPWDKKSYTDYGAIFPDIKWSKSGALLIRDTGDSYLYWGDSTLEPGLQLATTTNLLNYTLQPGIWLPIRNDSFDSLLVEAGPMPLPISDGNYLMLYNSARHGYPSKKPNWDVQYNVGFVILDGKDPTRILYRSDKPILSPEEPWEIGDDGNQLGLTPNVVFVEGWTPDPTRKDTFVIFYGAADSVVGVAELTLVIS